MYKFKVSKLLPFWARNNENKPNKAIFNKWVEKNMIEVNNLSIHFTNFVNITLNGTYNDIKYIQIINTIDQNDTRYYYVNAIDLDGGNNTFKYSGVIDIYASYTLKFIEDNLNKEFVFLRTHKYSKECLQIRDEYLDNIPKIYNSYYFKKMLFNEGTNQAKEKVWYGETIGIVDNNDLLNANRYYVFKDGVNGSYSFFPVISKASSNTIYYKTTTKGKLKEEYGFSHGIINGEERVGIASHVNKAIVEAYKNGLVVEYKYWRVTNNGKEIYLSTLENVPYGTLPIDIKSVASQYNHAGAGIKRANFEVFLLGNSVYSYKSGDTLAWDFLEQLNCVLQYSNFRVMIYNATSFWNSKIVRNSITELEELRRRDTHINKFLGIYYLPHFLNFDAKKLNFFEGYAYFNINPQEDHINLFKIYKYQLSNIDNQLNNTTYSTEYFLRYLNIRYFGNMINAEYRTNDQHVIYLGGKMFFTDTCNIVSKSNEYISLNNSIINYPYQLPLGTNEYEQYVKANRNVVETGFNIAKREQELSFIKTLTNGALGFISGGISAASNAISGNIAGATQSTVGMVSGLTNIGFDITKQFMGLQNQEEMIRAQYKKAQNTMGTTLMFSNIETASLMEYYNDNSNDQYEGVEVNELDKNTLRLMNNYIYLNGYMLPNTSTFNDKINNARKFNYIQLDATLLDNQLNIVYDSAKYNNDIYQMIKTQLLNGLRIWNNVDETLPDYDPNQDWVDQPDIERPEIPNQPPPTTPKKEVIKISLNITQAYNNTLFEFSETSNKVFYLKWNETNGLQTHTFLREQKNISLELDFQELNINQPNNLRYLFLNKMKNVSDNISEIKLIKLPQYSYDYIKQNNLTINGENNLNIQVFINGELYDK